MISLVKADVPTALTRGTGTTAKDPTPNCRSSAIRCLLSTPPAAVCTPAAGGCCSFHPFPNVSSTPQSALNRAVSRATGGSVGTIRRLGFLLSEPGEAFADPDDETLGPSVLD